MVNFGCLLVLKQSGYVLQISPLFENYIKKIRSCLSSLCAGVLVSFSSSELGLGWELLLIWVCKAQSDLVMFGKTNSTWIFNPGKCSSLFVFFIIVSCGVDGGGSELPASGLWNLQFFETLTAAVWLWAHWKNSYIAIDCVKVFHAPRGQHASSHPGVIPVQSTMSSRSEQGCILSPSPTCGSAGRSLWVEDT